MWEEYETYKRQLLGLSLTHEEYEELIKIWLDEHEINEGEL